MASLIALNGGDCEGDFFFGVLTVLPFLSPHRRIDVSPSAFKKHTRLFEDMEESDYKVTERFQNLKFQPSLCAS